MEHNSSCYPTSVSRLQKLVWSICSSQNSLFFLPVVDLLYACSSFYLLFFLFLPHDQLSFFYYSLNCFLKVFWVSFSWIQIFKIMHTISDKVLADICTRQMLVLLETWTGFITGFHLSFSPLDHMDGFASSYWN